VGGGCCGSEFGPHHSKDWEDYELEVVIKCSYDSNDPDANPDDDYASLIAVMESNFKGRLGKKGHEDDLSWSSCDPCWTEGLPWWRDELFQQVPFCYLFHEIYEHALSCDLDALLRRIGEIEIGS